MKSTRFDFLTRPQVAVRSAVVAVCIGVVAVCIGVVAFTSCSTDAGDAGKLIAAPSTFQFATEPTQHPRPEAVVINQDAADIKAQYGGDVIDTDSIDVTIPQTVPYTIPTTPTTDCMGGPVTNPDGQIVGTLPVSC